MGIPQRADFLITPEEYLHGEELSEQKHEYLNGVVHAMAGGTTAHADLGGSIFGLLFQQLRGKRCRPFNSDMRLKVQLGLDLRFYYPDVMIVCDPRTVEHWQDAPGVIFEVLSDSTERTDQGEKRDAYLRIPTLDAYVLVDSRKIEVLVYRRSGEEWAREAWRSLDDTLDLPTIGCTLALREIYEGVSLSPPSPPTDC